MSNYEISKSSLLSLKAEIIRKQDELRNKGNQEIKKLKKVPLIIKNKDVDKRNETDTIEDLKSLENSRIILERKAKLYEKLCNSKVIDDDPASLRNRYLVRFKDKEKNKQSSVNIDSDDEVDLSIHYDEPENSDEQWVEYIDCLGRTRTCLKKDLEYCKSRDKDYKREGEESDEGHDKSNEEKPESIEDKHSDTDEPQLLSDSMRKEIFRQQWEKEEIELMDKDDIHYQDILFNEARTHGVGYYGFSKDEEERRKQQESLDKLRKETTQEQKKAQELKLLREQQLSSRVKAAKMRKRIRLGLPVEEEDEEPEIGPLPPHLVEVPEKSDKDILKDRLLEEARKNHIRPWDIGKKKVKEFYEYTQDEWNDKKRSERNDEFAPPSSSRRDFRATPRLEVSESNKNLNRFTTKKNDKEKSDLLHINPYKKSNDDLQDPFNEETRTFNPYTPSEKVNVKRKYDEINSKSNEPNTEKVPNDIQASIEAGLKFLRKQTEQKKNIRDCENDDMFSS